MKFENLRAFCLNLARRPDRRLQAWRQFRREGLEVERVVAADALGIDEGRGWRNKGARACAAGHRLAWRQGRRAGAGLVVVFEDDVVLCRGFRERLAGLVLPEDWQIVYFGCVFRSRPEVAAPGLLRVTGPTWDRHGYLLRSTVWPLLSRALANVSHRGRDPLLNDTACDVIMAEFHSRVPTYAVWPPMAWQVEGLSNNENCIRGNYRTDGTQRILRHNILHLPGVMEDVESGVRRGALSVSTSAAVPARPASGQGSAAEPEAEASRLPSGSPAVGVGGLAKVVVPSPVKVPRSSRGGRGILLSPYSVPSERMAWGQVWLLRRHDPDVPVLIYAQDYLPVLPWGGIAEVVQARGS